jgi:hypothetical protein
MSHQSRDTKTTRVVLSGESSFITSKLRPLAAGEASPSRDPLMTHNANIAPTTIFRFPDSDCTAGPSFNRANRIDTEEEILDVSAPRILSPDPFSPASQEELDEREPLSEVISWTVKANLVNAGKTLEDEVDYAVYFGTGDIDYDQVMTECDDFSLSSHDEKSLCEDLDLDCFSSDPDSFWEERVSAVRLISPEHVNCGSGETSVSRYSTVLHLPDLNDQLSLEEY